MKKEDKRASLGAIRKNMEQNQIPIKYAQRVIPIDYLIDSNLEDMEFVAKKLAGKIKNREKWRITVDKRHTQLNGQDIIEAVAKHVNRPKVDLENPDKILRVEVIGKKTGMSLHNPEDVMKIGD